MFGWLGLIKQLWRAMLSRLSSLLGETSGTTLALTGILGLAAVVYALYHLRAVQGGRKRDEQQQQPFDPTRPSTSAAAAAAAGASSGAGVSGAATLAAAGAAQRAAAATPAAAVARRLAGVRRVTLSVPAVLLEEGSPSELDESASVRAGAAELAREVCRACGGALYLLCHVSDDIGEAVVRGALEHAGLLGSGPGQVLPHRLLFCGTLEGKVSLVRQLEPDMHIDGHPQTVSDLQRFVKQLVLVQPPGSMAGSSAAGSSAAGSSAAGSSAAGSSAAGIAAANVQQAPSLAAALGVHI